MFISEAGPQIYLHELCLSPRERLCRMLKLPSPEPDVGKGTGMRLHYASATWAPDDTVVALTYYIANENDARSNFGSEFQVPSADHDASQACLLVAGVHHICHSACSNPQPLQNLASAFQKQALDF